MKKYLFLISLFLLSSCFGGRTKMSNFYNIVSIDDTNVRIKSNKKLVVGIELVSIPGYLDRPEIVTIKDENTELILSDFNRWAEPLTTSIQRVVANNISMYMPNTSIRPLNLFRKFFDYTVLIFINQFEGKFDDKAYLDTWYSIYDRNGTNILNERINLNIKIADNYNDLVEKQSILIARLSEQIAIKISKLR